ncbi:hypothetical protein GEOBRER4_n3317 [Citrifermentans bremense]|uniref:Uncharacterized protein n=1 Tax=Citrifermentans bremense TaxID=60035 RepID=A0A7R7IYU3_9BACT|nr:hypothetical protein GEOBRER4_n3317 [Citrifermentans bremense]
MMNFSFCWSSFIPSIPFVPVKSLYPGASPPSSPLHKNHLSDNMRSS